MDGQECEIVVISTCYARDSKEEGYSTSMKGIVKGKAFTDGQDRTFESYLEWRPT